jgi:alkylation response protein AidB-like acyl-CoA dehydrogenase
MGVLALTVPEAHGGLGMGFDDLVGILVECGRAGLPDPLADTVGVAAPTLAEALDVSGSPAARWLDEITAGAAVVSGFGPDPLVASAAAADGFVLFSADPASADPGSAAIDVGEAQVRVLERSQVQLTPVESVDGSRALSKVTHSSDAGTVLLSGRAGEEARARAFDRAALGDAAMLVGLARTMLDTTVEYVSERRQFGAPVGSFQAVKHHLADAGAAIEFTEPLVRHAAHLLSGGTNAMATSWSDRSDQQVAVSMAKARASAAAQQVSETSLQCHGAIGYTVEADLQLFMKRAWALSRSHGDSDWHRRRVRGHLLAPG